MALDERYGLVLEELTKFYPNADTELIYHDPFSLLVAAVLSAQRTDKQVNMMTSRLTAHFPTPEAMVRASVDDLLAFMGSASYPNNKAKHLIGLSERIAQEHHGVVPSTREELEVLPGAGHKSANVMLAVCFGTPAVPVDTHVFRVAKRVGLASSRATTPLVVEQALRRRTPREQLIWTYHQLILLGRYICKARKPLCDERTLTACYRHYATAKSQQPTANS